VNEALSKTVKIHKGLIVFKIKVFGTGWIVFGRNESKIYIEVIKTSNKRVITYKGEVLLFFKCNSHSPIFFL
jgi:superoxide dismutase